VLPIMPIVRLTGRSGPRRPRPASPRTAPVAWGCRSPSWRAPTSAATSPSWTRSPPRTSSRPG